MKNIYFNQSNKWETHYHIISGTPPFILTPCIPSRRTERMYQVWSQQRYYKGKTPISGYRKLQCPHLTIIEWPDPIYSLGKHKDYHTVVTSGMVYASKCTCRYTRLVGLGRVGDTSLGPSRNSATRCRYSQLIHQRLAVQFPAATKFESGKSVAYCTKGMVVSAARETEEACIVA